MDSIHLMQTLGKVFRARRKELKLTLQQVADEVGTDAGNVSRIERGEQWVSEALGYAIARALRLTIELHPVQHVANEPGVQYVVERTPMDVVLSSVPIVGTTTGGTGGYWVELGHPPGHGDGHLDAASRDRNAYALRVQGSSMAPRIFEGEYLLVEPNHSCQPGDEVVVRLKDGQIMVKLFLSRRNNQITLGSIASDERLVFDATHVTEMHYVAGVFRQGSVKHKD